MQTLHHGLLLLHIFLGSLALCLVWVPILSRKGGLNHRRFGRYYSLAMLAVGISGVVMSSLVLAWPTVIKAQAFASSEHPEALLEMVQNMWSLLLLLSWLTVSGVIHGNWVLKYKHQRQKLRSWGWLVLPLGLAVGGLWVLKIALFSGSVLHVVFGSLALWSSFTMLRYVYRKEVTNTAWLLEHIAAMGGSAVGAYTAFFAFGGRHLLSFASGYQLVFWIVPGIVGALLIQRSSRKVTA
ncbi:DUF2306 domain-containing protein [Idiomarina tyrosinivorans]|nr:DUF2306 domain-containing protein [Idiomarina tyrosinivorans]